MFQLTFWIRTNDNACWQLAESHYDLPIVKLNDKRIFLLKEGTRLKVGLWFDDIFYTANVNIKDYIKKDTYFRIDYTDKNAFLIINETSTYIMEEYNRDLEEID